MTAYELLWMYARLRGIPEGKIREAVDIEIQRLDLQKHAKNFCGTYRCVSQCRQRFRIIFIMLHEAIN